MPAGGSYLRNDMWIELRKKVKKVTTYHSARRQNISGK